MDRGVVVKNRISLTELAKLLTVKSPETAHKIKSIEFKRFLAEAVINNDQRKKNLKN